MAWCTSTIRGGDINVGRFFLHAFPGQATDCFESAALMWRVPEIGHESDPCEFYWH